MAAERERRPNAGSKMARLLDEEEEDDFYKTTYGGFNEEEDDNDYKSEVEAEDEVDSDFSIDENDEPVSDTEDVDGSKPQKRGRLIIKAYKEPKPSRDISKKSPVKKKMLSESHIAAGNKKAIRRSTQLKSEETIKRQKDRQMEETKRKSRRSSSGHEPHMTQEELLAEAKETEKQNLLSLEKYELAEMDRKKPKMKRQGLTVPFIRYHSCTMPLIQDITSNSSTNHAANNALKNSNKDDDGTEQMDTDVNIADAEAMLDSIEAEMKMKGNSDTENKRPVIKISDLRPEEKCERTFITFSDELSFRKAFKKNKNKLSTRNICPITRLPARYFDPVTRLPYASVQAYRILREAYYQQLEDKGDPNCPPVAAWLEYRKKYKQSRAQSDPVTTVMTNPAPATNLGNYLGNHLGNNAFSQAVPQAVSISSANTQTTEVLSTNAVQQQNTASIQQMVSSVVSSVAATQQQQQQHLIRSSTGLGTLNVSTGLTSQSLNAASGITAQSLSGSQVISGSAGLANQGLSGSSLAAALSNLSQQSNQQQANPVARTIYQQVVSSRGSVVQGSVRPQMVVVTTGSAGGVHLVQSGTSVQLVQSTAGGAVQLVQSGTGTVQLVQSGSGGGMQLVQSSSGGGMQLVQSGSGGSVQLVQGTGGAMQLVHQGGAGGTVQLVQPGRITLRPMTGQTFTNLQSLFK
ncbi:uncharacterized protein LOC108678304 [Hyalella azteca]|uniref:Vacuolar protein sorting-associated protein 72 homolog n=1 Tax=Hyalella azteca TaxID=294128 RepID=A0A8B7P8P0_HYAAZ|nr:uncharacterized protein LOC108678304 [Hyalella azteca]XP_047737688.1 uncharacterized protein LOC108678304 [Hyalella azteca]